MGADELAGRLPSTELRLSHVDVDLNGLDDFRTFIARELDANLRPAVDGIAADHRRGVGFGERNVGGNVQAARRRYYESLATSTANLVAYVEASEILIAAIKRITTNYRDSDLTSAAGSAAVNRELTTAIVAARRAQLEAINAARMRDWRQKIEQIDREAGIG